MEKVTGKISLIFILCLVAFWSGCILEEKVIQIVLTDETYADFDEDHTTKQFTTPEVVDYAKEIDKILKDNNIPKSKIKSASVLSAAYEVTDFSHTHDWTISGAIIVERQDIAIGPVIMLEYDTVSVAGALGRRTHVKPHRDGVSLLNQALQQFIEDTHAPVLVFSVVNDDVRPNPSVDDHIVFKWRGYIRIQVIFEDKFDTPDPF